ncbi:hypothetical protein LCGC14_1571300 [marine sediment metagenome]|uniref:Uncharacterized protein n=1 Tax=marine sediment metagenome TaxID=412755 RepID=A0A0F9IJQ8_9ZZZZ
MLSQNFSFSGWDLFRFLKGRKKMIVTIIATGLGFFLTDSATVAVVSGATVEMVFALAEYFLKKYD